MIISKTPFRISFAGGGTDIRSFYEKETGAVTSTAIDKYMFVTINKRFDHTIRVSYSKTEIVASVGDIKHPIVKEALRLVGIESGIEITSIADIPAGMGLGSSSSFTVGLINALYAYQGKHKSAEELAQDACRIEIDILGEPIGKQDQYAAAYGGLAHIQFNPDGTVFQEPVICSAQIKEQLNNNLMVFFTGISRKSNDILKRQGENADKNFDSLKRLGAISGRIREVLVRGTQLNEIGELLDQAWSLKKGLAEDISTDIIDAYYKKAKDAGALGGKISGAGGGGFLLLYCSEDKQTSVREVLKDLREIPFKFEPQGSKIIYVG